MSGVVIPDPRGGHVWIYGVDSAGDPVKILVDASGHLQVDVLTTVAAVTIADGADVAQGAVADTVVAAGAVGTTSAKLRRLTTDLDALLTELKLKADLTETQPVSLATAPITQVTVADGADTTQGGVTDAVVAAGAVGTVGAKLRRLTTDLGALLTELKLKADLTETQPVSIATMPTTTVQATGGDKIFSFESIVEEVVSNTALAAGYNTLVGSAVGAGKVWKITQACFVYIGTVPTKVRAYVAGLAGGIGFMEQASPGNDVRYFWSGEMYLQAGDYIYLDVSGATLNDDLYLYYAGVQMDAP